MSIFSYLPDNTTFLLLMIVMLIAAFMGQARKAEKKREEERKGAERFTSALRSNYCPYCGKTLPNGK